MVRGRKHPIATPDRHRLRLIQQVPAGTAGAFQDAIFGRWWVTNARVLSGVGGFNSVDNSTLLNDSGEFTVSLPPAGSDGVRYADRLYYFTGTPDAFFGAAAPLLSYMPGDEWIEVIRNTGDLVASGTPVSEQTTPNQMQLLCRDAAEILKKTRETGSGFWHHSPRDVFEHYTRTWQTLTGDDFTQNYMSHPNSATEFTSTDGRWKYIYCTAAGTGQLYMKSAATGVVYPSLKSVATVIEGGASDHGGWRMECSISSMNFSQANLYPLAVKIRFGLASSAGDVMYMDVTPYLTGTSIGGVGVTIQTHVGGGGGFWPVQLGSVLDAGGHLQTPLTLAIEARERWVYFFINGQLISVAPRAAPSARASWMQLVPQAQKGDQIVVDYAVFRAITSPMNGGQVGDRQLPSPPSSGGLQGAYYDMSNQGSATLSTRYVPPPTDTPSVVRQDGGVYFAVAAGAATPGWLPAATGNATQVYVRWTGAIYLPLATQDVTFQIPQVVGTNWNAILWVGKTRASESACSLVSLSTAGGGDGYDAETTRQTSPGMRTHLGTSVSGWYPLIFEYMWASGATAHTAGFTYNVGGAGSVPTPDVLSPYGCYEGQVPAADSHFDVLQATIGQNFGYQWRVVPQSLESGNFPATIVPQVRVGRDTNYVLDDEQTANPQETSTAADSATSVVAQAQGLGGGNSGNLSVEGFNFPVLASHMFTLTEAENLPATTQLNLLVLQLETLLALRSNAWQEVMADTAGQREVTDSLPLTGVLAEFDWQPGDGVRVIIPQINVNDVTPRQILALKRTLYPDGVGTNSASFRPRTRDFAYTMRKFIRQVYSGHRTFQGQLTYVPGTQAVSPALAIIPLPTDLGLVRQVSLTVLSKGDKTTSYSLIVNGNSTGLAITTTGVVDITNYLGFNNGSEPQLTVQLTTTSTDTGVSYMVSGLVLVPRA